MSVTHSEFCQIITLVTQRGETTTLSFLTLIRLLYPRPLKPCTSLLCCSKSIWTDSAAGVILLGAATGKSHISNGHALISCTIPHTEEPSQACFHPRFTSLIILHLKIPLFHSSSVTLSPTPSRLCFYQYIRADSITKHHYSVALLPEHSQLRCSVSSLLVPFILVHK